MKFPVIVLIAVLTISTVAVAEANGKWLEKVPNSDRTRLNPYAGESDAVSAGRNLFVSNCSHCHGQNAEGKGSRPSLHSERIRTATDGDLAWLLKNGEVYKGMPRWSGLPEQQRWQIISYIRSLNP
jgi:mono/diheme cytochrome c family protein